MSFPVAVAALEEDSAGDFGNHHYFGYLPYEKRLYYSGKNKANDSEYMAHFSTTPETNTIDFIAFFEPMDCFHSDCVPAGN